MVILDNLLQNCCLFTETFSGVFNACNTLCLDPVNSTRYRGGELSLKNHESRKLFVEFHVSRNTVFLAVMFIS